MAPPKKIIVLFCIGTLFFPGFTLSAADSDRKISIISARSAGFGGAHAALADDLDSLFSNPAGFRKAGPEFSFSEITVRLTGPIFDIASVIITGVGAADPQSVLLSDNVITLLTNLYASLNLIGPLSFGYVGGGLGFGFFNSSDVIFTTKGSIPTISAKIRETILFSGGYSFRIPIRSETTTIDLGAQLKAFVMGDLSTSKSVIELFTILQSPDTSFLISQPFLLQMGVGVDLGLLISFRDILSFGLVGRNLYAPSVKYSYATLEQLLTPTTEITPVFDLYPIDLSFGMLFSPSLGLLDRFISDFKIMLDYEDILDFLTHASSAVNPVLHIGLGMELVLLEILSIRAGFYQGLLTAGLGLDLSIFRLNLSMFGSELSAEPGLKPVYNLLLGLEFRY